MPGFGTGPWDPLGLVGDAWGVGGRTPVSDEATIGFCATPRSSTAASPWPPSSASSRSRRRSSAASTRSRRTAATSAGCTPQEQWDNIPVVGKLQILIAIGMLESYGEGAAAGPEYTHYMRGGQPGFYPDIKGKCNGQIGINLYDPFGFGFRDKPADKRARGLKSEILNGRAAMFGIMGFLRSPRCRARSRSCPDMRLPALRRRRHGALRAGDPPQLLNCLWQRRCCTKARPVKKPGGAAAPDL